MAATVLPRRGDQGGVAAGPAGRGRAGTELAGQAAQGGAALALLNFKVEEGFAAQKLREPVTSSGGAVRGLRPAVGSGPGAREGSPCFRGAAGLCAVLMGQLPRSPTPQMPAVTRADGFWGKQGPAGRVRPTLPVGAGGLRCPSQLLPLLPRC